MHEYDGLWQLHHEGEFDPRMNGLCKLLKPLDVRASVSPRWNLKFSAAFENITQCLPEGLHIVSRERLYAVSRGALPCFTQ
jgi:hypothetical protein